MAIRFIPVSEINDPLTLAIGLSGGSGTGKTFTSLLMARGIAEGITGQKGAPIGYVDTENKRALHYKAKFPEMMHFDFQAIDEETGEVVGFGPERWIEVIDAAEEAKLPVLIFDSFSHAWEGVGGVLDLHARTLDRLVEEAEKRAAGRYTVDPAKYSQLAWAEVKPRYRRLIDRIVRAKTNIIICTRAKPVMQQGFGNNAKNARATKTRRADVPWDPASDGDLMFEMTTMVILDPDKPGCPVYQIKVADQFKNLLDPNATMGVHTGLAMAEWAKNQGGAQEQKDVMDAARAAALGGTAAFTAWWNGDGKEKATSGGMPWRDVCRPIIDQLKASAKDADAQREAEMGDDPFAGDSEEEGTPSLSPEEEARIKAEIEAENARRESEAA